MRGVRLDGRVLGLGVPEARILREADEGLHQEGVVLRVLGRGEHRHPTLGEVASHRDREAPGRRRWGRASIGDDGDGRAGVRDRERIDRDRPRPRRWRWRHDGNRRDCGGCGRRRHGKERLSHAKIPGGIEDAPLRADDGDLAGPVGLLLRSTAATRYERKHRDPQRSPHRVPFNGAASLRRPDARPPPPSRRLSCEQSPPHARRHASAERWSRCGPSFRPCPPRSARRKATQSAANG